MPRICIEDIWPAYGLRVESGDLALTPIREKDLPELIELVLGGIHDPELMPFTYPWTDLPADEAPANYVRYFGRVLAGQTPGNCDLQLVVRRQDQVVGVQGLTGDNYPILRTLETGSWLGNGFHGVGIGTRMRQAACALAFDELGAERILSYAFRDNPASMAVSRKTGYTQNGRRWLSRRGQPAEEQAYVLTRTDLRRSNPVHVTGAEAYKRFLGLPA